MRPRIPAQHVPATTAGKRWLSSSAAWAIDGLQPAARQACEPMRGGCNRRQGGAGGSARAKLTM
eukprot:11542378-Alexandrium_andersonii.AAC.1